MRAAVVPGAHVRERACALTTARKILAPPPITKTVIRLHRIAHPDEPFYLNPDLILLVETTPDTVVSLTTQTKLVVAEPAEAVVQAVRKWRASVLAAALPPRPPRRGDLALVRGAAGEGVAAGRAHDHHGEGG